MCSYLSNNTQLNAFCTASGADEAQIRENNSAYWEDSWQRQMQDVLKKCKHELSIYICLGMYPYVSGRGATNIEVRNSGLHFRKIQAPPLSPKMQRHLWGRQTHSNCWYRLDGLKPAGLILS